MKSPPVAAHPNFAASVISVNIVLHGSDQRIRTTVLVLYFYYYTLFSYFSTCRSSPQYFHTVEHYMILHKQCSSSGQPALWICCPGNTFILLPPDLLERCSPSPFLSVSISLWAHAGPSGYLCPHQCCSFKLHLLLWCWLHLQEWRSHLIKFRQN